MNLWAKELTEAEKEQVAKDHDEFEHHVKSDFDYSGGEGSVPRAKGTGALFDREEKAVPVLEELSGQLDYGGSTLLEAKERIENTTALTAEELRTKLEGLAKKDDFKGHRALINEQIARLNGSGQDIERVRAYYVPLVGNDHESQRVLAGLTDLFCTRTKEEK